MPSGRKESLEKPVSPLPPKKTPDQPAAEVHKDADSPAKSGKPQGKAEFAQGNYYRQGVLVPGGPHKGAMPRTRNR